MHTHTRTRQQKITRAQKKETKMTKAPRALYIYACVCAGVGAQCSNNERLYFVIFLFIPPPFLLLVRYIFLYFQCLLIVIQNYISRFRQLEDPNMFCSFFSQKAWTLFYTLTIYLYPLYLWLCTEHVQWTLDLATPIFTTTLVSHR